MNFFQYHVELVKALAWPVTVLVVAFIFRADATALLKRIVKGKLAGAEFEFEKTVEVLSEKVAVANEATTRENLPPAEPAVASAQAETAKADEQRLDLPPTDPTEPRHIPKDLGEVLRHLRFLSLETNAITSPRPSQVILHAWELFEHSLVSLASRHGLLSTTEAISIGDSITALWVWNAVRKFFKLPASITANVEQLRKLRNTAAADPDFSPSSSAVVQYIRLVESVVAQLDGYSLGTQRTTQRGAS